MQKYLKKIFFVILLLLIAFKAFSVEFKISTYNVENLFDLNYDGREYSEFIPDTGFRWDNETYNKKIKNITKVICDIDADILALQEIESEKALKDLISNTRKTCKNYPYFAIAIDNEKIPVRCALLSTFPIVDKKDIKIDGDFRDILKATLNIYGNKLIIYINHWKSKSHPESYRLVSAKALLKDIRKLKNGIDYIITGDFNENYNEYKTSRFIKRLEDTKGITGINHILRTYVSGGLVDKSLVLSSNNKGYHYNLWLEAKSKDRFSYMFAGKYETPDSIIIPETLFDKKGINYRDNSFYVFKPPYLYSDKEINRWKRAKSGNAWHVGDGYSDHLPLVATFTTEPFIESKLPVITRQVTAEDLYKTDKLDEYYLIRDVVVIQKVGFNALIKQIDNRAIYCYRCLDNFQISDKFDLIVNELKDFKGLREIVDAKILKRKGKFNNIEKLFIDCKNLKDFKNNVNEVCKQLEGVYKNGFLHHNNQKIKLYFADKKIKLKNNTTISLKGVRIGYSREPEIVVENKNQIFTRGDI